MWGDISRSRQRFLTTSLRLESCIVIHKLGEIPSRNSGLGQIGITAEPSSYPLQLTAHLPGLKVHDQVNRG